MPDNKLSAKEAALIAQVRAELKQEAAVPAKARAAAPLARAAPTTAAAIERAAPAAIAAVAPGAIEPAAPAGARPAPILDPAERVAALMAAARAETERLRLRRRQFYVWAPFAFICAVGLWTLFWVWHRP